MKPHFVRTFIVSFLIFTRIAGFSQSAEITKVTESTKRTEAKQIAPEDLPVMTFVNQIIDLGDMKAGTKVPMIFRFTNTGETSLFIEHISACKCSDIQWTDGEIKPGEEGEVHVLFDSTGYEGNVEKTVDIIANTDPIVVETFFKANVIKGDN